MGDKDYFLKFPGIEDYIRSGKAKDLVPNLEIIHLPEGSHFVQEQSPEEVNQLILTFLNKHVWLPAKAFLLYVLRVCWRLCESPRIMSSLCCLNNRSMCYYLVVVNVCDFIWHAINMIFSDAKNDILVKDTLF